MFSWIFGPCKVCLEKDKRIADLQKLYESQTKLLSNVVSPYRALDVAREANIAMEGAGMEQEPSLDPDKATPSEVELQAIRLLTGTY